MNLKPAGLVSPIIRKVVHIHTESELGRSAESRFQAEPSKPLIPTKMLSISPTRVLVVNSSADMARAITLNLTECLPQSAITYAPTIEIAQMLLRRNTFEVVVSNTVLPDGPVTKLMTSIESAARRPAVIVYGKLSQDSFKSLGNRTYACRAWKTFQAVGQTFEQPANECADPVHAVSADLKNDLNNPLQQIVAMAFVARSASSSDAVVIEALDAIEAAAKNLSSVVWKIEDRIRDKVIAARWKGNAQEKA